MIEDDFTQGKNDQFVLHSIFPFLIFIFHYSIEVGSVLAVLGSGWKGLIIPVLFFFVHLVALSYIYKKFNSPDFSALFILSVGRVVLILLPFKILIVLLVDKMYWASQPGVVTGIWSTWIGFGIIVAFEVVYYLMVSARMKALLYMKNESAGEIQE